MERRFTFLLATALLLTAGCAGHLRAHLPGDPEGPEIAGDGTPTVGVGDAVHVTLRTGEELNGKVLAADAVSLTLDTPSEDGGRERTLAAEEIAEVEVEEARGAGSMLTTTVAIAAIVGLIGWIAVSTIGIPSS